MIHAGDRCATPFQFAARLKTRPFKAFPQALKRGFTSAAIYWHEWNSCPSRREAPWAALSFQLLRDDQMDSDGPRPRTFFRHGLKSTPPPCPCNGRRDKVGQPSSSNSAPAWLGAASLELRAKLKSPAARRGFFVSRRELWWESYNRRMPTVLRWGPYRFYFYSHEPNEAPHIDVDRDDLSAKFWRPQRRIQASGHLLRKPAHPRDTGLQFQ